MAASCKDWATRSSRGASTTGRLAASTLGGNILQRSGCWYFRSDAQRCLRRGGGRCYAIHGENQYHAIFANEVCAVVHPSTLATALVALHARIELVNAAGETGRPPLDEFFVAPEVDVQRENDLRPGEIATAVLLPPLAAGTTSTHLRESDKLSFDWSIADVAVRLERDEAGPLPPRRRGAGRRGPGSAARAGSQGPPGRESN